MIQLKHKLRSNAKIVVLLDKYIPDTFELKVAKSLDNIVRSSIIKYQNLSYSHISKEKYAAKCITQESLRKNNIIRKLEEQYFVDNSEGSLLAFYKSEIEDFIDVRDSAARAIGPGMAFIYESFNITNKAVAKRMADYSNIIELFCSNYFAILYYEKNVKEEHSKSTTVIYKYNSRSVNFYNSMSIETSIFLSLKARVDKLQKQYDIERIFKAKKEHAYIIEYFISDKLGLDLTRHSERQLTIHKLYGVPYNTYYPSFVNYQLTKNKMKKNELAQAIVFVSAKMKEKINADIFDNDFLEVMLNKFDNL